MSGPNLSVEIEAQDVAEWLSTDLPAWATRTRFSARLVEREGLVLLAAGYTSSALDYANFVMTARKIGPGARPSAA